MTVVTKTGDRGKTSLPDKEIGKEAKIFGAIGCLDETNSYLGLIVSLSTDPIIISALQGIQSDLLTIGSILVGAKLRFSKRKTEMIEEKIVLLEKKLPPLNSFILPGGSILSCHLHICRTIVRRMEREMVSLTQEERIDPSILSYVNRLSDYLFCLARYINYWQGVREISWNLKRRQRKA